MFTIMAGLSQFERDIISQRTKEGLASARACRKFVGRKTKLDDDKKQVVYDLYLNRNNSVKEICIMFGISKTAFYKIVEQNEIR